MSDDITKGCLTHYDNRHMQVRFDFLGICAYDRDQFQDRRKEEPNQECMAKILRLFETLTDHARQGWQIKAINAKEKGLTIPPEPKEYRFELTNGAIVSLIYDTFRESTVRNSLDYLSLMDCIGRYQEKNNSIPVYWLKFVVVQALLKTQAEQELSASEIKPHTDRGAKSNPKRPKSNPKPLISNTEPPILDPVGFENTDNNIRNKERNKEEEKRDTGVSAIATPPPVVSSSHEMIPIATTTPDTTTNDTHSHHENTGDGVVMAIGNDPTKGQQTHGVGNNAALSDASPGDRTHPHVHGVGGDTQRTPPRELSPRDRAHHGAVRLPGSPHHGADGTPARIEALPLAQGVTADASPAADLDLRLPAVHHRSVGSDHPSVATQALESTDAHEPVSASPTALWPPSVVVSPLPPRPQPEETPPQVTHTRKPAQPKPEPTLDEIAFKKRCDALQTRINEDWRGYALTDKGPMINERVVIKKLVTAFTDTQLAQIHEYLFTRHFKFSKPDYRYTIGAQIMWEQGKNVAQILRDGRAEHTPTPPSQQTAPKAAPWFIDEAGSAARIARMREKYAAQQLAAQQARAAN